MSISITAAYIFLAVSIAAELVAATFVTATKGFTAWKPSLISLAGYLTSYLFFGITLLRIDLGITYATWGAAGMIVTSIAGYLYYKQKLTKIGLVALICIIIATITLNLWGSA